MDYVRTYWIFGLGFVAQSMFALRIIVQWWLTEKSKQVASPALFWILSLGASALFLIYGVLRHDLVIILSQVIAYLIYIRNLQLKQYWITLSPFLRFLILAIPVLCIAWIFTGSYRFGRSEMYGQSLPFFLIGMAGQWLLNLRFVYQLYYSEKNKASALPAGFWWMSLAGSILVITYALHRHDPVLLVAQGLGIVPYTRNILFSRNKRRKLENAAY